MVAIVRGCQRPDPGLHLTVIKAEYLVQRADTRAALAAAGARYVRDSYCWSAVRGRLDGLIRRLR